MNEREALVKILQVPVSYGEGNLLKAIETIQDIATQALAPQECNVKKFPIHEYFGEITDEGGGTMDYCILPCVSPREIVEALQKHNGQLHSQEKMTITTFRGRSMEYWLKLEHFALSNGFPESEKAVG